MMTVDMYIALVFLLMVISFVLQYFLRRKYNITTPDRFFKFVNNTHKWIEIFLFVLVIIIIGLFWFVQHWVWVYLLITIGVVLLSLRAYVEYKYEREERQYIITLVNLVTSCVLFVLLLVNYS
ncbi:DUF4181 domain-containing protein [Psychrobacillus sp. MER TA 171]|uniref:DUF4181 domain-containing protein n=1 Tax=Psychrobacillus sp. MER TA 171 TaxID=2939577 RepID=UPI0020424BCB|nr:DUF4181 domain-containing protein [Psychrobacillus sp. MER TA 171]MCM3356538.1 DUF4181 domain-containing protein [Psychrobacillus sp. MER TA 171]